VDEEWWGAGEAWEGWTLRDIESWVLIHNYSSQVTQRTATEVYWVSFEDMTFSGRETLPEWSMDS
jgi:hypothetical protein